MFNITSLSFDLTMADAIAQINNLAPYSVFDRNLHKFMLDFEQVDL